MTKEEILNACKWDDLDWAHLEVYSAFLGNRAKVIFMPNDKRQITDKMAEVFKDFLFLKSHELDNLKNFLWEDAQRDFSSIDYGAERENHQSLFESNCMNFKVFDRESAFASGRFTCLRIEEDTDGFKHRYGQLLFRPEWSSHGCGIVMRDGKLIDSYEESVYFGWFEEGGKFFDSPCYLKWRSNPIGPTSPQVKERAITTSKK